MTQKVKALLVEDTEDDAELTLQALRIGGLDFEWRRVETEESMTSALQEETWDVILADYALPQFSAPGALAVLKASGRDIPFIIVSGMVGEEDAIAIMRAGAADYVMKDKLARLAPVVQRELAEAGIRAERRRSLEDLIESEARFRMMADSAPVYLWLADCDGRCTFFNEGWLGFTGRKLSDEIGFGWVNGVHENDREACMEHYLRAIKAGKGFEIEFRHKRADGAFRWILNHGRPLFTPDGTLKGFIGSCTDFTVRKEAEEIKEGLFNEERRVSRFKDEFLATLSHELRTPMTAILGWSDLLLENEVGDDEMKIALETINRNAKIQTKLICDLLEMSRIITGKIELDVKAVDFAAIVKTGCDSVALSAEAKGVTLRFKADPSLGILYGDETRLQQVAWNLLSNAVKFTPRSGQIDVELDRQNSRLRLQVKDSGEGIDPGFLPYVFDRFQQADGSLTRRHGGLGLGLAIVRHITELHGGSVTVKSEGKGKGSVFTVMLPLMAVRIGYRPDADVGSMTVSNAPASLGKECLEGARVLIVDDQPDSINLIYHVLKQYGANVLTASSATEAMVIVKNQPVDALVSDIEMPNISGLELIRTIRSWPNETSSSVPAIALTAHAREEDRDETLAAGFDEHLSKPVELMLLLETLAKLLAQSFHRKQDHIRIR